MEKKYSEVKADKKSIWAMIKESMNKASSGCGPGCGCHVEYQDGKSQQMDAPKDPGKMKEQA